MSNRDAANGMKSNGYMSPSQLYLMGLQHKKLMEAIDDRIRHSRIRAAAAAFAAKHKLPIPPSSNR